MTGDSSHLRPVQATETGGSPAPEDSGGDGLLRVMSVNWQAGGVDSSIGDAIRLRKTLEALTRLRADVVLCQEIAAASVHKLQRHLWHIANQLGMIPLLGPEDGISGNHPAILINTSGGLRIIDAGPPPHPPGTAPSWCEAVIEVPGLYRLVRCYSVHLPPRSAAAQLAHAQDLAATIAGRGEHAIAGGDFSSYARGDTLAPGDLEPPHLRPARMRQTSDGTWTANYDVHDALTAAGLADIAAHLPPAHRDPAALTPTGITGGGRPDRIYLTKELVPAARGYTQHDAGGSDHHILIGLLRPSEVTADPPLPYL
jgi:endonuclease/exonuclease/phosphatase family metal-dependent hydrolase